MKKKDARGKVKRPEIVLLADLAPREDVRGGAGTRLFGERLEETPVRTRPGLPAGRRSGREKGTRDAQE